MNTLRGFHLRAASRRANRRGLRSFTLTELLVAIGVIAVVGAITVISVRGVARSTKLASAQNTVIAALDNARAIAIRDNKLTLVAFRARKEANKQVIEAVIAQWTGESYRIPLFEDGGQGIVDRFVPVSGITSRRLPSGIMVAAPLFGGEQDMSWITTTDLNGTSAGEMGGAVIAVMYGPDGTVRLRNSQSDSARTFVDFNQDFFQRRCGIDYNNITAYPSSVDGNASCGTCSFGLGYDFNGNLVPLTQFFCQRLEDDEPYLSMAPYLAVFDYDDAREQRSPSTWSNGQNRVNDLSVYITENAPRIHFNRYTGVVLR
ncbi:MAG TPA: hypothetical protein PK400_00150 [Phycisphaerales bacterium]|nr:hypothetical protein [Phycisphaerales bacterium]HRQ75174.1 hypothetical protein [Phycisphaerales bacterium]